MLLDMDGITHCMWHRNCCRRLGICNGRAIPQALANDNFCGHAHKFIVENQVRWIEAVTAAPFFTALVTYYIEGVWDSGVHKHVERAPERTGDVCFTELMVVIILRYRLVDRFLMKLVELKVQCTTPRNLISCSLQKCVTRDRRKRARSQ